MDWNTATHYEALYVTKDAPLEVIRASYERLIEHFRTEKGYVSRSQSERIIARLNEAWRVLSDPSLRAQYDLALQGGLSHTAEDSVPSTDSSHANVTLKKTSVEAPSPLSSSPRVKRSLGSRILDATILVVCLKLFGILVVFVAGLTYGLLDKRARWVQLSGAAGAGVIAAILVALFVVPPLEEATRRARTEATGERFDAPQNTSSQPDTTQTAVASSTTLSSAPQSAAGSRGNGSGLFDDVLYGAQTPQAPTAPATSPTLTPDAQRPSADATAPAALQHGEEQPTFTGKPISVDFKDVPLPTVAVQLSEQSGIPFVVIPQKQNLRVTIHAVNRPWDELLNDLAVNYNFRVRMDNGVVVIY